MTDKELRKLNRSELLEMLLELREENETLRLRLKETEAKLNSKTIELNQAGSIAEAALRLNGVFEAAEAAAAQYVANVKRLADEEAAQTKLAEAIEAKPDAKSEAQA